MLLPRLGALLLAATVAQAFQNTSPFLLLSSDPFKSDAPLQSSQVALSRDVEDKLIETLGECDQKWYYIFSQQHVSRHDFKNAAMPKLQKRIGAKSSQVVEIAEVGLDGELNGRDIEAKLEKACSAKGKRHVDSWPEKADEYRIIVSELPSLPADAKSRAKVMRDTDDNIDDTVASVLDKQNPSVLIYITSPPTSETLAQQDSHLYEMDEPYPSALHTDLKRDLDAHKRQDDGDSDMQAGLPLFEKYQFLSPGLFMGLSVGLLLLIILYVGISAIAGLEVSYAAFSKENGPQGSKGKQQ